MSRRTALLSLAWAYARHELRRRFRAPPTSTAEEVLAVYDEDRLRPLTAAERAHLPAMSRCISCGLCAMVLRRVGGVPPPDLASAYLRDLTLLPPALDDLAGRPPTAAVLYAASAACPVGVPLEDLTALLRRLAMETPDPQTREEKTE